MLIIFDRIRNIGQIQTPRDFHTTKPSVILRHTQNGLIHASLVRLMSSDTQLGAAYVGTVSVNIMFSVHRQR
jgi:hypothetical protein